MKEWTATSLGINWKTIVVTAIVTGLVTLLANVLLGRLQAKEPKLVYAVSQTIPFPGQNEIVGIYQVTIANEGTKEVDSVVCNIQIENASIKDRRILANPSLIVTETGTNDTVTVSISSLNPTESIQISILAGAPKTLPPQPNVTLRAKGVTGILKTDVGIKQPEMYPLIAALIGALTGMLFITSKYWWLQKEKPSGKHEGDQRDALAYLCMIHGLNDEAQQYFKDRRKTTFWAEADRLTWMAIESGSDEIRNKTKDVLLDLLSTTNIAEDSAAITLLNVARLEWISGNRVEAKKLLDRANANNKAIVEMRKSVDKSLSELFETTA